MELKMIKLKEIHANPLQPRQEFDREKLQELADSIKEAELLQPIVVRDNGNGYEIVAGERRYKAFQILKEPKIPAVIRDIKDDTDALEKSLIENLQRDDLTSVERENAIGELWDSGRYKTQKELAKKIGVTPVFIGDMIGAKEFRNKAALSSNISSRTIDDTSGLSDEPRIKILKQVEEKKVEPSKVRDVVRKVKEFSEPEQQLEILDEYEQAEDWGKERLDIIVKQKKERALGNLGPEITIKENKYERFVDELQNAFQNAECYGISNIETLPKVHYDRAIKLCLSHVAYWMNQLKQIGGNELIDELNKRLKE